MDITYIFKSFFTTEKLLGINNEELTKYAYYLRAKSDGVTKSNVRGWQSDELSEPNLEIGNLVDAVIENLKPMHTEFGLKEDYRMQLGNLWININNKSSFNRPHRHPESTVSGVYYVSVPKDSGNIVFNHPAVVQSYHINASTLKNTNSINASTWHLTPESGLLIMFPSWLEHYVEPSNSDEDRISIAFNAR
jgi:uncharacterized protein (TIGR02466 family)